MMKLKQHLLVIIFFLATIVGAIQPLKNLHVSIGADQVYKIENVSTVDELVQSLRRRTSLKENFRIIHKGRILNRGERLRDVGVLDGARLVVLTDAQNGRKLKTKEVVALLLASTSDDGWKKFRQALMQHPEVQSDFSWNWDRAQRLQPNDVYGWLKNCLDQSYHSLFAWWERPNFRASLTDHETIEDYRKLILAHISPGIINDIPWLKKNINSKARWRNSVTKVAAVVLRTGDVVLEGMLALLLDVLEGNGKAARARTHNGMHDSKFKGSTMEDPNLEDLLFELSDSDSDA